MILETYNMWATLRTLALYSFFGLAATSAANTTLALKQIPGLPYLAGVTLSGMDFASHNISEMIPSQVPDKILPSDPFTIPSYDQAMHYLDDRHLNLIKLPLAWESLDQYPFTNKLNRTKLEIYTDVIATFTGRKASVILTLSASIERFTTLGLGHEKTSHKGGLKNINDEKITNDASREAFVKLWGQLAYRFKNNRRVILQLMEVPHGVVPPRNWNATLQAAVTEIRNKGARNVIILPSFAAPRNTSTFNTFKHFPRDFEKMKAIKNPDQSTNGIVFDLSLTLGPKRNQSERCGGVNATAIVQPVVKLLREHNRQAIVGTLAAGSEDSCTRSLAGIAKNISLAYPHLAGFVLYGAGAFPENLPWSLIKEGKFDADHCSENWIDQPNFKSVAPYLPKKQLGSHSISDV